MGSLNLNVNYPALIQRSVCGLSPLGFEHGRCCSHNTAYPFKRANSASWNSLCDRKRNAGGKDENTKGKERKKARREREQKWAKG